jgi:hypothetical protein
VSTIVIGVVLVLALIGLWLVVGFARYRHYFRQVDAFLASKKFGSLYGYPNEVFLQLDDVVKRAYFAKRPIEQTAAEVIDEAIRILGNT